MPLNVRLWDYDLAKPGIEAAQAAAAVVAQREHVVAGRVTFTTTAALGQYVIAPRPPRLIERYPALQVELRLTEQRINIVAEGVDLAVRMRALDDSELVARKMTTIRRHLVPAPAYLTEYGIPHHPSDLASHRAIVTNQSLARWRFSDSWATDLRWNIAAGNMLVAQQLALAWQGIAMLPDFLLTDDLANGRLIIVLADHLHDEADAWLVSSRQRYQSLAVRAVLSALTMRPEATRSQQQ